jgi:hypothetical protein
MRTRKKYLYVAIIYGILFLIFMSSLVLYYTSDLWTRGDEGVYLKVADMVYAFMQFGVFMLVMDTIAKLIEMERRFGADDFEIKEVFENPFGVIGTGLFLVYYYLLGNTTLDSLYEKRHFWSSLFVVQIYSNLFFYHKNAIEKIIRANGNKYWLWSAIFSGLIALFAYNMDWVSQQFGNAELIIFLHYLSVVVFSVILVIHSIWLQLLQAEVLIYNLSKSIGYIYLVVIFSIVYFAWIGSSEEIIFNRSNITSLLIFSIINLIFYLKLPPRPSVRLGKSDPSLLDDEIDLI